jgi:hypothetical protein
MLVNDDDMMMMVFSIGSKVEVLVSGSSILMGN